MTPAGHHERAVVGAGPPSTVGCSSGRSASRAELHRCGGRPVGERIRYVGLDVGKATIQVAVVDTYGTVTE